MLMTLQDLSSKYKIHPKQVLHIGAHLGEEAEEYYNCGDPVVCWVEANPNVIEKIKQNISFFSNQYVVNFLVTDQDGQEREFHLTNYDGMSSSIFDFDRHPIYSPDTVFVNHLLLKTITISSLCDIYDLSPDMLCLDIQGAELLALRGAGNVLNNVRWIYTEVSTASVYDGGAQMHEIDAFLEQWGARVETDLGMHGGTHGDALYIRRDLL